MAKRLHSKKMGEKWSAEMMEALEQYVEDEKEIADKIFEEVADDTRDLLKNTSPERTGAYASGWEVKQEKTGLTKDSINYIVCNPTHYQLTHLLERGHQSYSGRGGPYKRVKARKHIAPAEQKGIDMLLERLRNKL